MEGLPVLPGPVAAHWDDGGGAVIFDRRPDFVKPAVGWWEWNVAPLVRFSRAARVWFRLRGRCFECGLKRPRHKMDCSTQERLAGY